MFVFQSYLYQSFYWFVLISGYECEAHDNPADFYLDSILHNQAAIAASENTEAATEGKLLYRGMTASWE